MTNFEKIMSEMTPEEYAYDTTRIIDEYETPTGYYTLYGNFIVPDDVYIESEDEQEVVDAATKWLKEEVDE